MMSAKLTGAYAVALCVLVGFLCDPLWACTRLGPNSHAAAEPVPPAESDDNSRYSCEERGPPISVTFIARNELVEPTFEISATVRNQSQGQVFFMLQRAADKDNAFRFSCSYYGTLGFMIDSINKLASSAQDRTYWKFLQHPSGNSINIGVSTYIPIDGETLMFNFTNY